MNPKRKSNPSTGKFIEGTRVVIPYIKGLREQYRCTLSKYKIRVFFKATNTIKSLPMHPKDQLPDAQKINIIYHWKCSTYICTAKYIVETNRSLKERVSDHRNQTTSAIRNHHISTNYPEVELKDFKNNRQRQQHLTPSSKRSTSHLYQNPSLNRNIGKVRIPSVFNKLLTLHTQLEQPHSSIPHPRGVHSSLGL